MYFKRQVELSTMYRTMEGHNYDATVKDSAVAMYFKRQVELSTMYRTMEGHNYDTAEDAILAVKSGSRLIFLQHTRVLV